MIYFLKKAAIREDLYLFSINQLSFDLLKKKLLSSELKEKNIEIFLEFFELYRKKIQFYSYSKDQFKKDRIFSKKIMNRKEEFLIFNQLKVYELKLKDFLFSIPNHLFFVEKFLTSNFSRDFFLKKTKNEYIGYHFHLKKPFISNNKIQTFKFFFLLREIKKILKQDQKQIHKKSDFDFLFKKYIKSASLEMQHFDFSFKVIHLFIFIYELNLKDYILLKIEYDFLKYLFKNKKVSKRLIQLFFTIKKRLLIKKRINQFFKKKYFIYQKYTYRYNNLKENIFSRNFKLVFSIIKKYENITKNLDFSDVVQEGYIALMYAIDSFSLFYQAKFSTYATLCISKAIFSYIKKKKLTTSIFDDIQKQSKNIILSKSISHPNFFSRNYIEEAYIRKDFKNIIQKILNGLSEKERKIIQYRFGFFDGQYYSLQEVGDKLNLSRERIRQIEKKALLYLKRNLLIKNFKVSF